MLQSIQELNEEKDKLEKELKLVQLELKDTLALNIELVRENKKKDLRIAKGDEYFANLKEQNATDYQQHELEKLHSQEKMEYEVSLHSAMLEKIRVEKKRYDDIERENEEMQASISKVKQLINDDEMNYALALHEMNKELRVIRQQMEATLRREMMDLDLSFQNRAFMNLDDKQKKAMLINAKLKDEVAVQSVGQTNLGVRLSKQKLACSLIKKDLVSLHHKAKDLRNSLGQLRFDKNASLKIIGDLDQKRQALVHQKETLVLALNEGKRMKAIEAELNSARYLLAQERALQEMWQQRKVLLEDMFCDIKPTTLDELAGHYNPQMFEIAKVDYSRFDSLSHCIAEDSTASQSRSFPQSINSSFPRPTSHSQYMSSSKKVMRGNSRNGTETRGGTGTMGFITPISRSRSRSRKQQQEFESDVSRAIKADKYLSQIVAIEASESTIMATSHSASGGEIADQNMAKWVTFELINIWQNTEKLYKEKVESLGARPPVNMQRTAVRAGEEDSSGNSRSDSDDSSESGSGSEGTNSGDDGSGDFPRKPVVVHRLTNKRLSLSPDSLANRKAFYKDVDNKDNTDSKEEAQQQLAGMPPVREDDSDSASEDQREVVAGAPISRRSLAPGAALTGLPPRPAPPTQQGRDRTKGVNSDEDDDDDDYDSEEDGPISRRPFQWGATAAATAVAVNSSSADSEVATKRPFSSDQDGSNFDEEPVPISRHPFGDSIEAKGNEQSYRSDGQNGLLIDTHQSGGDEEVFSDLEMSPMGFPDSEDDSSIGAQSHNKEENDAIDEEEDLEEFSRAWNSVLEKRSSSSSSGSVFDAKTFLAQLPWYHRPTSPKALPTPTLERGGKLCKPAKLGQVKAIRADFKLVPPFSQGKAKRKGGGVRGVLAEGADLIASGLIGSLPATATGVSLAHVARPDTTGDVAGLGKESLSTDPLISKKGGGRGGGGGGGAAGAGAWGSLRQGDLGDALFLPHHRAAVASASSSRLLGKLRESETKLRLSKSTPLLKTASSR